MGLYKRGKAWWISYTDPMGVRRRESTGQTNKKDAEKIWAGVVTSVINGTHKTKPQRSVLDCPSFEIAVESYVEEQESKGRRLDSYKGLVGCEKKNGERTGGVWVEAFKGRRLDSITSEEIESRLRRWQTEREWTNATRNNRLAQLSGFFSYAYRRRWIEHHPTERGRVAKVHVDNARERWLRRDEIDALVEAAEALGHTRLVPVIQFAVATGMRLSEVCGLRREVVEQDDRGRSYLTVQRTKNDEPFVWPLAGETLALVERQLEDAPFPRSFIFPGPRGGSYKTSVPRHLKQAAEKAGIAWGCTRSGFTFHSLRRTMASLGINNGIPRETIQRVGNWKTAAMVDRYAKFSDETLREAATKLASITSGKGATGGGSSHSVTPTPEQKKATAEGG
jgi:integrase